MTIPTQHNCPHDPDGWCLSCVGKLANERDTLRAAGSWEADHQRTHLEALGLADEFPFDCDSIQHVGEALLAARARVKELEEILARVTAALPRTKDGETITLGVRVWYVVTGDDGAYIWRGTVTGLCAARVWVRPDDSTGLSGDDECEPSDLYSRHPETGLTVEEFEATAATPPKEAPNMAMPEGFKTISAYPWHSEDGSIRDMKGRIVCENEQYLPIGIDPDDQSLIARAPDHALLLYAITGGFVQSYPVSDGVILTIEETGDRFRIPLDPFGCPVLSDEARAAIVRALEA